MSVLGLAVFGLSPASSYLIAPLEDRFPIFKNDHKPVTGIILLGGAEQPEVGLARGLPTFSDAAERPMAFADLARRYPGAKLAIVGGGGIDGQVVSMMNASLAMLGVPPTRVVFEDKSRNTAENALFAKALLSPKPSEHWLLVTSAAHMPRAIGCFRKVGFPVTAYPVDFHSLGFGRREGMWSSIASNLEIDNAAMKEWIGLLAYYLAGKTDELFPGVQEP